MAQTGFTSIVTYNTATASATPTAPNLTQGELAVNVTDKKIYTKDSGGNVVQVGSGPTATETLTNKTLTTPVINGFSGTGNGSLTGDLAVTGTLTTNSIKEDAAGNLGLGVVPIAGAGVLQVAAGNQLNCHGDNFNVSSNSKYVSGWKYVSSGISALRYEQLAGAHSWYTAPSGTAGNAITFTQAMDLDSTALTGGADNVRNLGSASKRWATVYAGTGTINTSDKREKTEVRALTGDEINAGKALSKEIGVYQFLASVAAKGDKARHHVGMTVQRAIEIMEANNLDPFAYGFVCFDQWNDKFVEHPAIEAVAAAEAVLDAEGNVVTPAVAEVEGRVAWIEQTQVAGDRYAFRYDQLNLFIAAGLEARLTALEAA